MCSFAYSAAPCFLASNLLGKRSCEIRELRSIRCFEFSFLVFPFHSKCEWLTFTVLLSLQRRKVEAEQIDVAKVLYTCKCLRWFPVFSFLLGFLSNFKWSNAGFVARLRCMDSSAVHRAVLKYIVRFEITYIARSTSVSMAKR